MKFTKSTVAALLLPEGKSELIVFDDAHAGFGFRIRAGGKRTWVLQYRVGSKQRRLTLGAYPALGIDAARVKSKKEGAKHDPQGEKAKARADVAVTLGSVIEQYLAVKRPTLRPSSYSDMERYLLKAWKPLHARPIGDISRADIAARLVTLASGGATVAPGAARGALSSLFAWATREGLVEANPVINTNRPALPRARDRVLTDAELIEVWRACRDDDFGRIVRLLILSGQRREEVAGMQWSEIDLEAGLWSLPGSRTKNHRPHEVPLSDAALGVLETVVKRADRDLLFGEGEGGFSGWSRAKEALDGRIIEARAERNRRDPSKTRPTLPWRLHDLRRTVATRMADLGIQPHIIEAVLNHVSGARAAVAGIYNRALYAKEKSAALVMWGEHVAGLVSGAAAKVVPLRQAIS